MELAPQDSIKICLDGEPVAKGRARFSVNKKHGFVRAYTPAKTTDYEDRLRFKARSCMMTTKPFACPVKMVVTAFISIPSSWSVRKKIDAACGGILPAKRPDVDNFAKAALDALNNIAYLDDSQVIELTVSKEYSEKPRLEIEIAPFKIKLRAV